MTPKKYKALKLSAVVALLIVAGISLGVVIQSLLAEQENRKKQEQLQQLYQQDSAASGSASDPGSAAEGQQYANPQFESLLQINGELAGWLEVGELNTPVVQTDNNEYYLSHDFYGKEDPHGTVFADARNRPQEEEDNLILYGHNYNKSKQIFYEVERYKDPAYVTAHPVISFTTLQEKRDYLVFGVFLSNTEPTQGEVFDYHNKLQFRTVAEMNDFIAQVRERSLIQTQLPVDAADQLITLSTCGYDFSGERVVLMARRLRGNEELATLKPPVYTVNPNPLMPEIWTRLYGRKASAASEAQN